VLADNLKAMKFGGKTFAVFAMLKDKDIAGVVKAVKSQISHWLVADTAGPRGAQAASITEILKAEQVLQEHVTAFSSPVEAYRQACKLAAGNDRITVFGSFHTVGDVLGVIENRS
jgi:dihydrofolate synthase/folylpolyglutamate synthase